DDRKPAAERADVGFPVRRKRCCSFHPERQRVLFPPTLSGSTMSCSSLTRWPRRSCRDLHRVVHRRGVCPAPARRPQPVAVPSSRTPPRRESESRFVLDGSQGFRRSLVGIPPPCARRP